LRRIKDDCGRPRTVHAVPFFSSRYRHTQMVTNSIVEDGCSIHTVANVSRRILSGVFGGSQVRP